MEQNISRAVTQADLDYNKDLGKGGAKIGDMYSFPVRPVTEHDLDALPHLKENGVNVGDTHDFTV